MSVTIVPFTADHAEQAAALLAARHRGDRVWAPDLSPEYEEPTACLPIVQEHLAAAGTSGVVALCGNRMAGYLLGAPELGSPTHTFAGFMHPRAAEIPYAGHAADPNDCASLYPRLYAALAQHWVESGLVSHYITVPANRDAMETWWDLGCGRFMALGVRKTSPADERGTQQTMNLEFRRATDADEEAIQALVTDMFRTVVEPPIFPPFLPETTAERRRLVAEHLADPACPY